MRKRGRVVLLAICLLMAIVAIYGVYIWNKPARDVSDEESIKITAIAIFDSFSNNEQAANQVFLNKAIEVTGKVVGVQKNQAGKTVVYLQSEDPVFGINCTFRDDPGTIDSNSVITFKGICTGYLDDVVLNEGVLIK